MACAVHTPYFFVVRYFADRVKKSGLEILFFEKFLLSIASNLVVLEEKRASYLFQPFEVKESVG